MSGYFPPIVFVLSLYQLTWQMRKAHRPGDNTQEAIRGVLIELPDDCINRCPIIRLKSQMKCKLFIYFVCLVFALCQLASSLTEALGEALSLCGATRPTSLAFSRVPLFTHTAGWWCTGQSSLQTLLEIPIRTTEENFIFWITTETPRIGLDAMPASATRWQNPNP